MKNRSQIAVESGSRARRIALGAMSALIALSISVTGSGVTPVAAAASPSISNEGGPTLQMGAAAARARAYWPNRFTASGNLTALPALLAAEGGAVTSSRAESSTASLRMRNLSDAAFAAMSSRFAARGVTLTRVRRYTIDASVFGDGTREADYANGNQWDLYGPSTRNIFKNQYGANIAGAWSTTRGKGAVVAVLDTGILRGHPELSGAKILQGYDFVCYGGDIAECNSRDNDGTEGADSDPSDPGDFCDGEPSSWHGTHVTGTIAAQFNRRSIAGIAPDVTILPVRVLGQCGGEDVDINAAIRWAAGLAVPNDSNGNPVPRNTNKADVINLSLGGWGECDDATASAIHDATAAGTLVVVAAGNSSDDARNYSPAGCDEAFTVAASDPNGGLSYYTSVGPAVDITAPGGDAYFEPADSSKEGPTGGADQLGGYYFGGCPYGEARLGWDKGLPSWTGKPSIWCTVWQKYRTQGMILSTISSDAGDFAGNYTTDWYQGTSMATPHVVGVAALIRAAYPRISVANLERALTESATRLPRRTSPWEDLGPWVESYVLSWASVYHDEGTYGLDWPAVSDSSATWTTFFHDEYFGDSWCNVTALGVVGFDLYGFDPCATSYAGLSNWDLTGWSISENIFDDYVVGSGDDCVELGCGAGGLNAAAAMALAKRYGRK